MWISTWPDPERSEGRYCNVFGFRDLLIKRLHIYADPDFAGADRSRFLWGEAAIAGLGVALLPDHACAEALRAGRLVRLFPDWHGPEGIVHLVFTTRRGLPRQVRAWIDHLAERCRERDLVRLRPTPIPDRTTQRQHAQG